MGGAPGQEAPWDYMPLSRMKQRYEAAGFKLAVIEARPPLNLAKRGLPGGDAQIDTVCTLLENMGKLGIPVWCYEWMTDFNWIRTNTATPSRGGSVVTSFDAAALRDAAERARDLATVLDELATGAGGTGAQRKAKARKALAAATAAVEEAFE